MTDMNHNEPNGFTAASWGPKMVGDSVESTLCKTFRGPYRGHLRLILCSYRLVVVFTMGCIAVMDEVSCVSWSERASQTFFFGFGAPEMEDIRSVCAFVWANAERWGLVHALHTLEPPRACPCNDCSTKICSLKYKGDQECSLKWVKMSQAVLQYWVYV